MVGSWVWCVVRWLVGGELWVVGGVRLVIGGCWVVGGVRLLVGSTCRLFALARVSICFGRSLVGLSIVVASACVISQVL